MTLAAKLPLILLIIYLFTLSSIVSHGKIHRPLSRKDFPEGFIFGAGSSAYQYEGAASVDGKGPSMWDIFVKNQSEKISDHSTGNVAEDFYHRYKEDVKLMKETGLDSFRFSISWSRVLPKGKICGGVNRKGIKFYNDLIDELLAHGIKPLVTLMHFDPPQALEDEYGGLLSRQFVDAFRDYADLCFKEFGDKVQYWTTINEPNIFASLAYAQGVLAPGRCSSYEGNCTAGNSATEPYIVAHNLLLSHAAAVKVYREKYQATQKGQISISTATHWFVPLDKKSTVDKAAVTRSIEFFLDWIVNPVVFGDYPQSMRQIVGKRLPVFTKEESESLKMSFDFLGINYYTAFYVEESNLTNTGYNSSYTTDNRASLVVEKNGVPICETTDLSFLHICPWGLRDLMLYIKKKYNNPPIYITENGMAEANNSSMSLEEALEDHQRVNYLSGHLSYLLSSIKMGANVKGYYVWSFLDNFEWSSGYTVRFGMYYIDYKNVLKRYKKRSVVWFKKFLRKNY